MRWKKLRDLPTGDLDDYGRTDTYRMCLVKFEAAISKREAKSRSLQARDLIITGTRRGPGEDRPLTASKRAQHRARRRRPPFAEESGVKERAAADIIETTTGEAVPGKNDRALRGATSLIRHERWRAPALLPKNFGPAAKSSARRDKHTQYVPERPVAGPWQGLMEFWRPNVAMPWGMPPSTLLTKLKSADAETRRDLAAAACHAGHQYDLTANSRPFVRPTCFFKTAALDGRPKKWARAEGTAAAADLRPGPARRLRSQDLRDGRSLHPGVQCDSQETTTERKLFRQNAPPKIARANRDRKKKPSSREESFHLQLYKAVSSTPPPSY